MLNCSNWEQEASMLRLFAEGANPKTAWEFRKWRSLCKAWIKHEPENPEAWENLGDSWSQQPTLIFMSIIPKFFPPIPGTRKWNDYKAITAYRKVLCFAPNDSATSRKLEKLKDHYGL